MGNNNDEANRNSKGEPDLVKKEAEKESVMKELQDLKTTYDDLIFNGKSISVDLIQERDKVMKLMSDLAMIKGGEFSLKKYRDQVTFLQRRLQLLTIENAVLKQENKLIAEERDSTKMVLNESKKRSENLRKDLVNTVEKGSKLAVSGAIAVAYKLKSSGELIVTDKANRVNGVNVSFMISKNELAKPVEKHYFIQIMNGQNTVLGQPGVGVHQYKTLTYSFAVKVKYEKKEIHISENFTGDKFAKGTYYVNIFDKEELVEESTFTLK